MCVINACISKSIFNLYSIASATRITIGYGTHTMHYTIVLLVFIYNENPSKNWEYSFSIMFEGVRVTNRYPPIPESWSAKKHQQCQSQEAPHRDIDRHTQKREAARTGTIAKKKVLKMKALPAKRNAKSVPRTVKRPDRAAQGKKSSALAKSKRRKNVSSESEDSDVDCLVCGETFYTSRFHEALAPY